MTKSATRKLATALIGTEITTADGTGTVTDVWTAKGVTWIGATIKGAGFNGSDLKTAVQA